LLDLSALNLGENPAEVLLASGKVALNSGITFGPESGQFVRLNFATSEEIIEEAVKRIVSCVK
jgi:cystathionine beta-lyase